MCFHRVPTRAQRLELSASLQDKFHRKSSLSFPYTFSSSSLCITFEPSISVGKANSAFSFFSTRFLHCLISRSYKIAQVLLGTLMCLCFNAYRKQFLTSTVKAYVPLPARVSKQIWVSCRLGPLSSNYSDYQFSDELHLVKDRRVNIGTKTFQSNNFLCVLEISALANYSIRD